MGQFSTLWSLRQGPLQPWSNETENDEDQGKAESSIKQAAEAEICYCFVLHLIKKLKKPIGECRSPSDQCLWGSSRWEGLEVKKMAIIHRGTSGPWDRSVPTTALAPQAKQECIQGYMPFSHHMPLLCSPGELQSPAEDLKVPETINKQNFTLSGSSELFSLFLFKGWRKLGVKNCPPPSETPPPEPSPCAQPCSFC